MRGGDTTPEHEAYAAIAQAVYLAREEMSLDAAATLRGLIYGDERITDVSPTDGDYDADDDWY